MKNKFKYILIILIALLFSLFAGCAQININAVITSDNKVSYTYDVFFEGVTESHVNYTQLKFYLNKVSSHWKDEGFETQISEDSIGVRMVSVLENQFDTREEAFAALYSYMTNETTPFVDVEYAYNQDFYHEDYFIKSHLYLSNMVDNDIYDAYPSLVGDDVDEFFDTASCTVTISLPYNDSQEFDEIVMNEVVTDIPFDAPKEISITGIINNNEHVQYEKNLLEKKAQETRNLFIFGVLTLLCIIGLVIILRLRKKNKLTQDIDTAQNN